ncbi:uncharacterized protein LOC133140249 isoform X1 [Conger conger]|uniref:uncharacterized protein LOC133140249 isoform X1 n=1 Tax=Conger conger TaxID=82655 RepID=UPI002A5A77E3|nr:uncharacterized protein LOC133140249 isoform X1 [Conger conger]
MQPTSECVVDCVDKRGRGTDLKSLVNDQICSVIVCPTAQRKIFGAPEHTRPQVSNFDDQWSSESEGERGLNEFQRKMRREHQRALASVNKACVVVERNRRKRITVSCNKLRQLLPQVSGVRRDMVTVLEMTVAFLEYVNQATLGYLHREPPDDLCRWWLSETRQRRRLSQRPGCVEERTTCSFRARKNSSALNAVRGEKLSSRVTEPGPLNTPRRLSGISSPHSTLKFYAPSFWYSPTLSPMTSGNPPQISRDCSSPTEDGGLTRLSPSGGGHSPFVGGHVLCVEVLR